jgi:ABC-type multidrug transport system ATPase subunit
VPRGVDRLPAFPLRFTGAGKTTLLDVLAGRKNSGRMTGGIFVNGRPKNEATFNRIAAYCEQSDLHMPLATVREACEDAAALRLQRGVPKDVRRSFVSGILRMLELEHLADRKVGDPGSVDGLAPGERKRLTVGVELCANSSVLFLDEPTVSLQERSEPDKTSSLKLVILYVHARPM